MILVKDIGRFAKPEGNAGIWGGHPKVPAATSFMPWSSSLGSSLVPKRQQLIIKVFPLGHISWFCHDSGGWHPRMPQSWEGAGAGSTSPKERWNRGPAHPESITALPSCFSHLQRPGGLSLPWEIMKFCVWRALLALQSNLWRKPELSTR